MWWNVNLRNLGSKKFYCFVGLTALSSWKVLHPSILCKSIQFFSFKGVTAASPVWTSFSFCSFLSGAFLELPVPQGVLLASSCFIISLQLSSLPSFFFFFPSPLLFQGANMLNSAGSWAELRRGVLCSGICIVLPLTGSVVYKELEALKLCQPEDARDSMHPRFLFWVLQFANWHLWNLGAVLKHTQKKPKSTKSRTPKKYVHSGF